MRALSWENLGTLNTRAMCDFLFRMAMFQCYCYVRLRVVNFQSFSHVQPSSTIRQIHPVEDRTVRVSLALTMWIGSSMTTPCNTKLKRCSCQASGRRGGPQQNECGILWSCKPRSNDKKHVQNMRAGQWSDWVSSTQIESGRSDNIALIYYDHDRKSSLQKPRTNETELELTFLKYWAPQIPRRPSSKCEMARDILRRWNVRSFSLVANFLRKSRWNVFFVRA